VKKIAGGQNKIFIEEEYFLRKSVWRKKEKAI
jgi:hypothetical protein